jgi:ABC-2 type transport system ATP-binding protein
VRILDAPTSGLDPVLQDEFRGLLAARKSEGTSIWLTSHVMAEVERVADRVGLVGDGVSTRELSMEELRLQAASQIRLTFPHAVDRARFTDVPFVTEVAVDAETVVVRVNGPVTELLRGAAELGATEIETGRRDLDDVFLEMFEPEARRP